MVGSVKIHDVNVIHLIFIMVIIIIIEEEDIFVNRAITNEVDNYHCLERSPITRYSRHSNAEYIHRLHAL